MHTGTRVDDRDGVLVVHVVGDIDIATAPDLRSLMLRHLEHGSSRFILDLHECDFVDSIGLGTILGFLRRVRARSGSLVLVVPNDHQRRILEACDFDRIFDLHRDLETALQNLAAADRQTS